MLENAKINGYQLIKCGEYGVEEIIDVFDNLTDAEIALSKMRETYIDNIIGEDDTYFTIEDDYGTIYAYQIIPCFKKEDQ